jgi:tagatose-6-phosphate ketose/aldose isomerase
VLDDDTVVVVLRSADPTVRRYDDDIVRELRADRPGQVVVVGADGLSGTPGTDLDLAFPEAEGLDDGLRAVALVAVAQLLALHASVRLGCTPDNPFPDGSVNRVVRGVVIHPLDGERGAQA